MSGGCSSVGRATEFKSEDPGFDPLVWQDGQFFYPSKSTVGQTCLCLTPLHVYNTHPICPHVKDFISICRKTKRVGFTAGGIETQKLHIGGGGRNWVAPYYGFLFSPGKAAWIFCALHLDKKVVKSNVGWKQSLDKNVSQKKSLVWENV